MTFDKNDGLHREVRNNNKRIWEFEYQRLLKLANCKKLKTVQNIVQLTNWFV